MAYAAIFNNLVESDRPNVAEEVPSFVQNHTLVLDCYITPYLGHGRVARLCYIADLCPSLRVEALNMALDYVKSFTFDVAKYKELAEKLRFADQDRLQNTPVWAELHEEAIADEWIKVTTKTVLSVQAQLAEDLVEIRESNCKMALQAAYQQNAEHCLRIGDLMAAYRMYSRVRDYCVTTRDTVHMCCNMIRVAVYMEMWRDVLGHVRRAGAMDPDAGSLVLLHSAAGVAELSLGHYELAAQHFLMLTFDSCNQTDILSASNVGAYGAICALATFSRRDLQTLVLTSPTFKEFLELEPQLREAIICFDRSNYSQCLNLLEEIRGNLRLDIYLGPHVPTLYATIRKRGLIQYIQPYVSAHIERMALAFNTDVASMKDELIALTLSGDLDVRIDAHSNIIYGKTTDPAARAMARAIESGVSYQRRLKMFVLRAAMTKSNVVVKHTEFP